MGTFRGNEAHNKLVRIGIMKSERKPGKRHEVSKNTVKCPYFRSYYVGVCAGHKLPYVPNSDEKRRFCFNTDYSMCTIYETYGAGDPDKK